MLSVIKNGICWDEGGLDNFLDSLVSEKHFFLLSRDEIKFSELIVAYVINNTIVGIAGIRKYHGLYLFFIVVKSEEQGKHIGNSLIQKCNLIAQEKYPYLIVSVSKDNLKAINLYMKHKYKKIAENDNELYLYIYFNIFGRIMCNLLTFFLPLILLVKKKDC